jgi:hypothetical protein
MTNRTQKTTIWKKREIRVRARPYPATPRKLARTAVHFSCPYLRPPLRAQLGLSGSAGVDRLQMREDTDSRSRSDAMIDSHGQRKYAAPHIAFLFSVVWGARYRGAPRQAQKRRAKQREEQDAKERQD